MRRSYEFVNNNPSVLIRDVAFTNDPFVIAQMPKMVAINSAIEIDRESSLDLEDKLTSSMELRDQREESQLLLCLQQQRRVIVRLLASCVKEPVL